MTSFARSRSLCFLCLWCLCRDEESSVRSSVTSSSSVTRRGRSDDRERWRFFLSFLCFFPDDEEPIFIIIFTTKYRKFHKKKTPVWPQFGKRKYTRCATVKLNANHSDARTKPPKLFKILKLNVIIKLSRNVVLRNFLFVKRTFLFRIRFVKITFLND